MKESEHILIERYVAEVNRHPLLSRQAEAALACRAAAGDDRAAQALVLANLRFVVKVAHSYRGYGLPLLDLVQEGNLGLIAAVRRFQVERGYRLVSYAVWWIRAYIHNFIIRSWSLVKVGTTNAQRSMFFKLRSERAEADRLAGGVAPVEELARRLGVRSAEAADMEARLAARDFSLDAPREDGAHTHLEQLAHPCQPVDLDLAQQQRDRRVREHVDAAMQRLSEKERYVVTHRLMSEEPQTLEEIGRVFQLSRERVRQIESKVLRKLRAVMGMRALAA